MNRTNPRNRWEWHSSAHEQLQSDHGGEDQYQAVEKRLRKSREHGEVVLQICCQPMDSRNLDRKILVIPGANCALQQQICNTTPTSNPATTARKISPNDHSIMGQTPFP
uniref:Uncharacterized protein n=1 Tax=Candidatus Kentrum sp. FM TaxID=2126340 RepID=A0A450SZI5_9GAMM|nr:MAG: hypothetical protein BECKFM1743C_GA0114222_102522 [Candidatus Kentron sp. FM]VFJ60244.1 MAG: hypothetical protein BECKFM1743A_GA0114220_102592 [Candidatus Kentron sp. FM]VFK12467.1 MAG: hypothetical protein BECKFM1743B_GA0114221_102442 [Candidatus Kentron sp. FM]